MAVTNAYAVYPYAQVLKEASRERKRNQADQTEHDRPSPPPTPNPKNRALYTPHACGSEPPRQLPETAVWLTRTAESLAPFAYLLLKCPIPILQLLREFVISQQGDPENLRL